MRPNSVKWLPPHKFWIIKYGQPFCKLDCSMSSGLNMKWEQKKRSKLIVVTGFRYLEAGKKMFINMCLIEMCLMCVSRTILIFKNRNLNCFFFENVCSTIWRFKAMNRKVSNSMNLIHTLRTKMCDTHCVS